MIKPEYYIVDNEGILGIVFNRKDGHKIILMLEKEINLQFGMEFRDNMFNHVDDPEVEEIIKNFVFWKE